MKIKFHILSVSWLGLFWLCFFLFGGKVMLWGQISGRVYDAKRGTGLHEVTVTLLPGNVISETDAQGRFSFPGPRPGTYQLSAVCDLCRFDRASRTIDYQGKPLEIDFGIAKVAKALATQRITDARQGASYLRSIEGMAIYAAKKTELIHPDSLLANTAANNARRLFVRVPGLNIWESDGGGLQLGIGGRGLSPNRSSNFNVRQNGYDIAGDALGYPESYYTPPAEAVERIEVVRGAASLQYGTQFGGVVNFLFKNGPQDKALEFRSRQTLGSFGFFNSFNSLGGSLAHNKVNYYGFFQRKQAKGWRPNSGFEQMTGFGSVSLALGARARLGLEFTGMQYLAQQAGGLSDALFNTGFQGSIRDRNWFEVKWNIPALSLDFDLGDQTRLNIRNFALFAERNAVGFLGSINRIDHLEKRDLLKARFNNLGHESRLLHKYEINERPAALLVGLRYYQGRTQLQQGFGSDGSDANFNYLDPLEPGKSDFIFPSQNLSFFAEHLFNLSDRFSLAPGLRYENIQTGSKGYYINRAFDFAGNLLLEETIPDQKDLKRSFLLAGLGLSYKSSSTTELYANWSQNYRAVTFTDLRVENPNIQVDPNLTDEKGFNADLGWRGAPLNWLSFDFSLFMLRYQDRIGNILMNDSLTFNYYRYRTNIADAVNVGLEWYAEAKLGQFLFRNPKTELNIFSNFSYIQARYTDSEQPAFDGNKVELVPPMSLKTGLNFKHKAWRANVQYSITAGHFSDATNAQSSPSSVEGWIPSYSILDASAGWKHVFRKFELEIEAGGQNLLNQYYFTRRATGYPGPGIIPSDIRNFYLSLEVKI